jgi:hypothetical protein
MDFSAKDCPDYCICNLLACQFLLIHLLTNPSPRNLQIADLVKETSNELPAVTFYQQHKTFSIVVFTSFITSCKQFILKILVYILNNWPIEVINEQTSYFSYNSLFILFTRNIPRLANRY